MIICALLSKTSIEGPWHRLHTNCALCSVSILTFESDFLQTRPQVSVLSPTSNSAAEFLLSSYPSHTHTSQQMKTMVLSHRFHNIHCQWQSKQLLSIPQLCVLSQLHILSCLCRWSSPALQTNWSSWCSVSLKYITLQFNLTLHNFIKHSYAACLLSCQQAAQIH